MKRNASCLMAMLSCAWTVSFSAYGDIIQQQPGTDYLVVEAELFENEDLNNPDTGWLVISPDDPQEVLLHDSNPGTIMVPPASSNPSQRAAIFDQVGGGDFADQVGYSLEFANPGNYYLYLRYSLYDLRSLVDNNYGNEDSIYLPVLSIDQDPADQELKDSRDGNVGLTKIIDGVEYFPEDGCRLLEEPWILSDEECDAEGVRGEEQFEGQYHWQTAEWGNGLGPANYEVEEAGVALDFAVATRERGTSLDVMIFSQSPDLTPEDLDALLMSPEGMPGDFNMDNVLDASDIDALTTQAASGANPAEFDLNDDKLVDVADVNVWVKDLFNSWIGDANLDGEFNSGDLVSVLSSGTYEVDMDAVWSSGDFNGDGRANSSDLVAALSDGGYELGPRQPWRRFPNQRARFCWG